MVGRFGWRPFFVTLGLAGLLWLIPWLAWMPRHTAISVSAFKKGTGVRHILRQRSAWGTCIGQFCINYSLYFLVTWLPFYLVRGRNLSMDNMAKAGSLIFFLSAASATTCGKLSDRWIASGTTPTRVRKTSMVLGQAGLGIFLAATAVTQSGVFVGMLALSGVFLGISVSNGWAITQTLAGPLAAGRWTGVQNFVGNFAGWVAPALTGFLVDRTGRFYWPFFICAAMAWIGALSWIFVVGRVEQVDWSKHIRASFPEIGAPAAPDTLQP